MSTVVVIVQIFIIILNVNGINYLLLRYAVKNEIFPFENPSTNLKYITILLFWMACKRMYIILNGHTFQLY